MLTPDDQIIKGQFEHLFRAHFNDLCCFARKYTGDINAAKEIVHDVFLRIWENRKTFEWNKPAKSYLYTAVYHRSLNEIRNRKRLVSRDQQVHQRSLIEEADYSNPIETAELEDRINHALDQLPERCREVFELSRFAHLKYSEIADQLQISVKTVETLMSKALLWLRGELSDYLIIAVVAVLIFFKTW